MRSQLLFHPGLRFPGLEEGAGRKSRLLQLSFRQSLNLLFSPWIESVPFPFSRAISHFPSSPEAGALVLSSREFQVIPGASCMIYFPIPQLGASLAQSGFVFLLPSVE